MIIFASDFEKGVTFEMNGQPYVALDTMHIKPGKGHAFVRVKYKNIITGAIREEAFNPDDKFQTICIETLEMIYLHNYGDLYYFLNKETYEQIALTYEQAKDAVKYLRENDKATVKFFHGNAFLAEAPCFVDLKITETEPVTGTMITKAATVETGAVIQVPCFIEEGERITIDTRTGEYVGRS